MKKFILGFILGSFLFTGIGYSLRISKPPRLTGFDDSNLVALNLALEQLWETTGRYNLNIVTTNPDGNTIGKIGDIILFNNSGTFYLEINTDNSTTWRGVQLTNTP